MAARYSTKMPDGRLLALEIRTDAVSEGETVGKVKHVYSIDGETVPKGKAEVEYNKQPRDWQRGRTFQQMIDFWLGVVTLPPKAKQ